MPDKTLEVLLTEYKVLRNIMENRFNEQLKLFSIVVSALGVAVGLIVNSGKYDMLILIPFIFIPIGLKAQHANYGVILIGEYLGHLEEKIRNTKKCVEWEGFQTFYNKRYLKAMNTYYDALSKYLLFILVPIGIAILYSLSIVLTEYCKWELGICTNITIIPPVFHLLLVIVYGFTAPFAFICVQCLNEKDWEKKLEAYIGVEKAKLLFKSRFNSRKKVKKASIDDLTSIEGIDEEHAQKIRKTTE